MRAATVVRVHELRYFIDQALEEIDLRVVGGDGEHEPPGLGIKPAIPSFAREAHGWEFVC